MKLTTTKKNGSWDEPHTKRQKRVRARGLDKPTLIRAEQLVINPEPSPDESIADESSAQECWRSP